MKPSIILLIILFFFESAQAGQSITQVGCFSDTQKNRIFTNSFANGVTETQIKAHAMSLPYTTGRLTAAYYYIDGSDIPANSLSLARNLFKANRVMYEKKEYSGWHYVFMIGFKGRPQFVNCQRTPGASLCRTTCRSENQ